MIRFRVVNFEIELDPATLLVPEFHQLLHADPSKDKQRGKAYLVYVFHMSEINRTINSWAEMPINERDVYMRKQLFNSEKLSPKVEAMIIKAQQVYHKANYNSVWKAVDTYDDEIYAQQEMLERTRREAMTGGGISLADAETRKKVAIGIKSMVEARDDVYRMAMQEGPKVRNRADVVVSPLETGLVKLQADKLPQRKSPQTEMAQVVAAELKAQQESEVEVDF